MYYKNNIYKKCIINIINKIEIKKFQYNLILYYVYSKYKQPDFSNIQF